MANGDAALTKTRSVKRGQRSIAQELDRVFDAIDDMMVLVGALVEL